LTKPLIRPAKHGGRPRTMDVRAAKAVGRKRHLLADMQDRAAVALYPGCRRAGCFPRSATRAAKGLSP
jgi:hypothetical protein